MYKDFEDLF